MVLSRVVAYYSDLNWIKTVSVFMNLYLRKIHL